MGRGKANPSRTYANSGTAGPNRLAPTFTDDRTSQTLAFITCKHLYWRAKVSIYRDSASVKPELAQSVAINVNGDIKNNAFITNSGALT